MPEEKKKRRKQVPIPDMAPPTLGEYLSHLFDNNALYTIEPAALTDAQFFWLLSDLGLGLSSDEITVLCRRAPQSNGKVDWSTFAPRCEELLLQTFRTRDWNTVKSKVRRDSSGGLCGARPLGMLQIREP